MKKTIEFEGFADLKSGAEFGLPILMVKPKRILMEDGGSIDHAEYLIENYVLDLMMGDKPKNDPYLKKNLVEADLARAKKGSKRFKRWTATVEYDLENDDEPFTILKKTGF